MRFRDLSGALRIVGGMFVGITLYANFGPEPEPEFHEIRVPTPVLVAGEPDTVIRWRERIVYRTVAAEQVVIADSGAVPTVVAFCRPSVLIATGDSARPAGNPALVRSAAYDGKRLDLWEARSNGDLARESFNVRAPWRLSMSDSAIVQGSRTWWVKPLLKQAALVGIGYGIGKLQ